MGLGDPFYATWELEKRIKKAWKIVESARNNFKGCRKFDRTKKPALVTLDIQEIAKGLANGQSGEFEWWPREKKLNKRDRRLSEDPSDGKTICTSNNPGNGVCKIRSLFL